MKAPLESTNFHALGGIHICRDAIGGTASVILSVSILATALLTYAKLTQRCKQYTRS